jgi:hypothetical protein
MIEWFCDMAMPIPIAIPTSTKTTASLKLRSEALMIGSPGSVAPPKR